MSRGLEILDGTQPCRKDPEAFFPSEYSVGNIPRARQLCRPCPFQAECWRYAIVHAVDGIWGGSTRGERNAYRKAHKINPIPVKIEAPRGGRLEAIF